MYSDTGNGNGSNGDLSPSTPVRSQSQVRSEHSVSGIDVRRRLSHGKERLKKRAKQSKDAIGRTLSHGKAKVKKWSRKEADLNPRQGTFESTKGGHPGSGFPQDTGAGMQAQTQYAAPSTPTGTPDATQYRLNSYEFYETPTGNTSTLYGGYNPLATSYEGPYSSSNDYQAEGSQSAPSTQSYPQTYQGTSQYPPAVLQQTMQTAAPSEGYSQSHDRGRTEYRGRGH